MQLCAKLNMEVCVPSNAAQIFHLLRRQMLRQQRKPLVVLTPKSLLRHKQATSELATLAEGGFELVMPEVDELDDAAVTRVVMCSGKVYYDLVAHRREQKLNVPVIRLEQLYPFPDEAFNAQINRYPKLRELVWCQEGRATKVLGTGSRRATTFCATLKVELFGLAPCISFPSGGLCRRTASSKKKSWPMPLAPCTLEDKPHET